MSRLSAVQRKWSDKLFAVCDKEGAGSISESSFQKLYMLVDPEADESEVKAIFDQLHDQNSGDSMKQKASMAKLLEEVISARQ